LFIILQYNHNMKIITFIAVLLASFFIAACDGISGTSDIKKFDYDRITITGYNEGKPLSGENDNRHPFRNFTKRIALKRYSEEGKSL